MDSAIMPRHIFISYSRKDTKFVEQLQRDLKSANDYSVLTRFVV